MSSPSTMVKFQKLLVGPVWGPLLRERFWIRPFPFHRRSDFPELRGDGTNAGQRPCSSHQTNKPARPGMISADDTG